MLIIISVKSVKKENIKTQENTWYLSEWKLEKNVLNHIQKLIYKNW